MRTGGKDVGEQIRDESEVINKSEANDKVNSDGKLKIEDGVRRRRSRLGRG